MVSGQAGRYDLRSAPCSGSAGRETRYRPAGAVPGHIDPLTSSCGAPPLEYLGVNSTARLEGWATGKVRVPTLRDALRDAPQGEVDV